MAVLAAENVSYTYQSKYQKVQALKNVSCTFEAGKFYAIIGQSGSGKTTLLSMLAGLGTPSEGEIIANGKTLKEIGSERHRRENVTVIYQSFNLFPTLNILENVMYPMQISKKPTKEAKVRAKAIARALASDAKVILADEPTGNLDTENGKIVIDLLKKLVQDENYCVIVVTHDPGIAAQADVVYKMQDGRLAVEC